MSCTIDAVFVSVFQGHLPSFPPLEINPQKSHRRFFKTKQFLSEWSYCSHVSSSSLSWINRSSVRLRLLIIRSNKLSGWPDYWEQQRQLNNVRSIGLGNLPVFWHVHMEVTLPFPSLHRFGRNFDISLLATSIASVQKQLSYPAHELTCSKCWRDKV